MVTSSAEEVRSHLKVYWTVFGALLVLTGVTVGVSYLHLPVHLAVLLALAVALVKGSLVAGYFMHLLTERKVIYWTLALTVLFFFFVLLIPVLTDLDVPRIPMER
jgi:cytochrome c oxidase subunit IV